MSQSIQQEAIDKITGILILDTRTKSIFLKGSIARGEDDIYSDVDYYCVVDELEMDSFLKDRIKIMEQYRPLIYYSEVNFVAPQIVGVFNNGLHFDFYTFTKELNEGADAIKTLYDPHNILQYYKQIQNKVEAKQVAEYINEFTLCLLEFEAAYCRRDFLWAARLGNYLIGYLSCVLSYIYDKNKPFLGMKRLITKLPDEIKDKIMEANNYLIPRELINGIKMLINILDMTINNLDGDITDLINIEFLEFMKARINNIKIY